MFIIVWLALGLEIALLGAALVIGFEIVLRAVSGAPESDANDAGQNVESCAPSGR